MKLLALPLAAFSITISLAAQETTSASNSKAIFEHAKAATVLILAGEGAGRLNSTASGVIISKSGVILTALHAVKGAVEV